MELLYDLSSLLMVVAFVLLVLSLTAPKSVIQWLASKRPGLSRKSIILTLLFILTLSLMGLTSAR